MGSRRKSGKRASGATARRSRVSCSRRRMRARVGTAARSWAASQQPDAHSGHGREALLEPTSPQDLFVAACTLAAARATICSCVRAAREGSSWNRRDGRPGGWRMALITETNRKWWTLAAVTFSLFMIMLDTTIGNVALPAIQTDFKAQLSQLEWTVNAYTLTYAVFLLTGGKLADLTGRRLIFMIGLIGFAGSSLVCAVAPSIDVLIAARAVQGVGAALMLPATLSIISSSFPPHERGAAIGIWAAVSGIGLAIGPLVGGILVEWLSWRWIFYINVPIGILGFIAALIIIRESRDPAE